MNKYTRKEIIELARKGLSAEEIVVRMTRNENVQPQDLALVQEVLDAEQGTLDYQDGDL